MGNSITKIRKLRTSLVYKTVAIIFALVLPINVLTVFFGQRLLAENQEKIQEETLSTLETAMSNTVFELKRANRKMIYYAAKDVDLRKYAERTENTIESSQELYSVTLRMKELTEDYQQVNSVYWHFDKRNHTVFSGYSGKNSSNLTPLIDRMRETAEHKYGTNWKIVKVDEFPFLISYTHWNDTGFGTITRLDTLISTFADRETGKDYVLTNQAVDIIVMLNPHVVKKELSSLDEYKENPSYTLVEYSMPELELKLYSIERVPPFIYGMSWMMIILELLAILFTLLSIPLLLFFLRRWIIKPINHLNQAMDKIESGNLDYRIEEDYPKVESQEFSRINKSFNSMMDQVQELKIDNYEHEIEKRDIRMRYLNQQVQPHFILNALNILYSYEPEEYEYSQKMIMCISRYFRHIVYANDKFVTLKAEMDHLENYFEIQKARFPELFYSIVEYEEDMRDALIPPLLLQTFAENAIKHSLKIGNKITIYVVGEHFVQEDGTKSMRIRFADTGEGISDEILQEIHDFERTGTPQEHLGVGIQNSIDRLKVLYEGRGHLTFSRDATYQGTNIEIILPLYFKGDGKKEYETFTY